MYDHYSCISSDCNQNDSIVVAIFFIGSQWPLLGLLYWIERTVSFAQIPVLQTKKIGKLVIVGDNSSGMS